MAEYEYQMLIAKGKQLAEQTSWYQPKAQAYLRIVCQPFFGKTNLTTLAPPVALMGYV